MTLDGSGVESGRDDLVRDECIQWSRLAEQGATLIHDGQSAIEPVLHADRGTRIAGPLSIWLNLQAVLTKLDGVIGGDPAQVGRGNDLLEFEAGIERTPVTQRWSSVHHCSL